MTEIIWKHVYTQNYEIGVDKVVFYPANGGEGIPWVGVSMVDVHNTSGDFIPYFMDGIKYQHRAPLEAYSASLHAYTYPDEFEFYDGTIESNSIQFNNQRRRYFDLSYRTMLGENDYRLHLVYNAMVEPSTPTYSMNSASMFTWAISSKPVVVKRLRPISHLIVDSTQADPELLQFIESYIYGSDDWYARMLTPAEVIRLFGIYSSGYGYGNYGYGLYGHGPGVIE